MKRSIWPILLGSLLVTLALWMGRPVPAVQGGGIRLPDVLQGVVVDAAGQPLAGVTVQVQGSPNETTTLVDGSFQLTEISWKKPVVVTAYTAMYMVGWVTLDPNSKDWQGVPDSLVITLKSLPATDNVQYDWFSFNGVSGSASCAECHREYEEWTQDAHSQSATNPRFLAIYKGTNLAGIAGQRTSYISGVAQKPDSTLPDHGPGYKLDEPMRTGNCASCHTPLAAKIATTKNCGWSGCHTDLTSERAGTAIMDPGVSPVGLTGDAADGISCDFCHKIGDVILDEETQLPKPDMPGILSLKLYRPQEGDQVFFGTYGDVSRRVSYSPISIESKYCAACHYGVFGGVVGDGTVTGGVVIYNSYGEWLDSPYSDPETGKTCQDCHMPTLDTTISVYPEQGGIQRDYADLHDHTMPGASDEELLQNAVTMVNAVSHVGNQLLVDVKVTNDQTGHSVPTDAPTREMILVVRALDAEGNVLALASGPSLPEWAGNYAGQPGKDFAKILKDQWTGEMPTAAYWRPVEIALDTRLEALASDSSHYVFQLPAGSLASVEVNLIFRRTYQKLAEQKGFTDPDILMEHETIQVEK
jgi:hypothetical protein